MIYLSVEGLSKQYPEQLLFENLRFGLKKGDKIGLIANNGTGKSSLLKILAGKELADEGTVYLRDDIKLAFLEQIPEFDESLSINDFIDGSHTDVLEIIRNYEEALALQSEHYSEQNQKLFEQASLKMDQVHGWDYERRLKQLLARFNITDLNLPIRSLSGGQKKRLAMAMALLDEPDLLIMDEPTNHLDIEMIEWLEKYLSQSSLTLLMVTHDRYFLDRICNHILELENAKLYHHKGNYAYFLEKRAERETVFKTEVDKAGKLLKKELEWMRRSPKARTTKAKSRINSFYEIKDKASKKTSKDELRLDIKMSRIGGKILEMKNVSKSFGDLKILEGFTHTFKKGERIGIVGKNGVGKSTFLNLILGTQKQDSGKINIGDTTIFGHYSQDGLQLKKDQRVIDVLKDIAEVITLGDGSKLTASQFLQHFLFPPKMQRTFVSKLSGGEKRRLYLLTVLITNPNFLILDEPTNDLDLLTLNKLEEFLESFNGCLILVSHDRYFMNKLVDQLFIFEGDGKIRGFLGTYADYREIKKTENKEVKLKQSKDKNAEKPSEPKKDEGVKRKLSYHEKREYEGLEEEIEALETEKQELEELFNTGLSEYEEIEKASARIGEIIKLIDEKTLRWMELDEIS
jgi:ATP-binding cassette subfamily F protein uup